MTYHELLSRLTKYYDAGEARAVVRLLTEKRFSLSWTEVLCGALESLTNDNLSNLEESVCMLEKGVPVQYVLGEAEFMGHSFHVEEGVLIPRPETEELVQAAISCADQMPGQVSILDIGTGSGCIAISMALANPDWKVAAWDISDNALTIAKRNAQCLNAGNVSFNKVDILSKELPIQKNFSVIISNPPYICDKEKEQMEARVLDHEPALALFVPDDDPLLFYRAISSFAADSLQHQGYLLFEINREYGKEMAELMTSYGFTNVNVYKDQFGNDRIVKGKKP